MTKAQRLTDQEVSDYMNEILAPDRWSAKRTEVRPGESIGEAVRRLMYGETKQDAENKEGDE